MGVGIRVVLTTHKDLSSSSPLPSVSHQHEAEYEAVLAGLQTVTKLRVTGLEV